jgi:hypothetical protein
MKTLKTLNVSWFSAGVSSAVATKLSVTVLDKILYTHIDDQHEDTLRFVRECEEWFGMEVEILSAELPSVEASCRNAGGNGYINGIAGASCTKTLKRDVRKKWEREVGRDFRLCYYWGFDYGELGRVDRVCQSLPEYNHKFPLVEQKIGKVEAHEILKASDIKRPAMYELGYHNNNCIGCVKGGAGYWNKIRRDFPAVFDQRAKMEREIGASCMNGLYLDELDENAGRHNTAILDDCGLLCELQKLT